MNRLILIFLLSVGCSYNQAENTNNLLNLDFNDNLSFEEFKILLDEYASNNPYPNINN